MEKRIHEFVLQGINLNSEKLKGAKDEFWSNLKSTGTELWLDTGDMDEAEKIWKAEMSALTTNNTLLNKEIQKGIYDDYILEAKEIVKSLPVHEQIIEIAFILNARHGLRIVEKFGVNVSVELHTDTAHDLDAIVSYGKRFYNICPDYFIIKVPLTSTGLLGARKLRDEGIPVNFTLEFGARQNALVVGVARPSYCNVFLGRINAYFGDNKLGTGDWAGEKAVIEAQKVVKEFSALNPEPTKLIAASLRSAEQLESLAGVDVFTMPTKVAEEGHSKLDGNFSSKLDENYQPELYDDIDDTHVQMDKVWSVPEGLKAAIREINSNLPETGAELEERLTKAGYADIFPNLSSEEFELIASDGKIPVHENWKDKIAKNELAIDTLLNLAGLASFTADQKALDDRIKSIIT